MEDRRKINEEITRQVQSAIAPFAEIINELRREIRLMSMEIKATREENKEFRDIMTGARFLGSTGKVVLMVGAIIGMIWGAFTVITHK